MKKWKAVRVKQELIEEVERAVQRTEYRSLSEFVSDAVQQRLQTLAKQRVSEYLERDQSVRTPQQEPTLLYTPQHMWARPTPEGAIEVGITEHFQKQAKEIVNIRTDVSGQKIAKDQPFGVAESWWFTFDLYAPLSGQIVEVNDAIIENSFLLNADPSQWIVKIQPETVDAHSWMNDLLTAQKYQTALAETP